MVLAVVVAELQLNLVVPIHVQALEDMNEVVVGGSKWPEPQAHVGGGDKMRSICWLLRAREVILDVNHADIAI